MEKSFTFYSNTLKLTLLADQCLFLSFHFIAKGPSFSMCTFCLFMQA